MSPSSPVRHGSRRTIWPHLVVLTRVCLAFAVLVLFSRSLPWAVVGVALTVIVIAMDGLDGYLARALGVASEVGAVLDIAGDRIVEHVFWIFFAASGLIPLWVPLVIVTRSFLVDGARTLALARGRTAFGPRGMQRSALARFLVASRFMRGAYGAAKVLAFVLLGGALVAAKATLTGVGPSAEGWLGPFGRAVTFGTVALCVVRGIPVVWEARVYARTAGAAA